MRQNKFLYLMVIVILLLSCTAPQKSVSENHTTVVDSALASTAKQKEGSYFLLKQSDDKVSLKRFDEDKIIDVGHYPINRSSIYTTDSKNRVTVLDSITRTIRIYDVADVQDTVLEIPYELEVACILMNEEYIFVGGKLVEEMLIGYHLQSKKWFTLEIPEGMRFPGKEIDDLLFNGDQLIAIDNLVIPKYIIYYTITDKIRPDLLEIKELNHNGPYECIEKGSLSGPYFGLLSNTSSGWSGSASHITIYKGLSLNESFSVAIPENKKYRYLTINDFCIVNNMVWIADKDRGLGKLLIKDSHFVKNEGEMFGANSHIELAHVQFDLFPDGEIEKLTLVPNTSKIILTIKQKGLKNREFVIKE